MHRIGLFVGALLFSGCSGPTTTGDGGPDTGASTFDAGPPQPCESPGAVEDVPCGSCGTVQRFCTSERVWAYGTCENEGECTPGSIDTVACGNCGEQMARCTTECTWMATGACESEGECMPGATMRGSEGCAAGEQRDFTCNDACTFEPAGECTSDGCTTPGALENVPCGMCGTMQRFCTAELVWDYEACMNEGVCVPGTTDTVACGDCGTQAARCTDVCQWSATGACMDEGECTPGQLGTTSAGCPAGQMRDVRCDDACAFTISAGSCSMFRPVDVTILLDVTGSNAGDLASGIPVIRSNIITPLLAISGVNVGVSYAGEFPIAPYGDPGDNPFEGGVEPTTSTTAIDAELVVTGMGGSDGQDASVEALSVLSGGPVASSSIALTCSSGRIAGGCWRSGAAQVIVVFTDSEIHNGPDPASTSLLVPYTMITPPPATWPEVLTRMNAANTTLFWLDTGVSATGVAQFNEMLTDLGQTTADNLNGTTALAASCATIVGRVRTLAGM